MPGDTVVLRQGVYRETVTFPQSGTSSAHITLMGFSGETATIDGCDVVTSWTSSNGVLTATPGWDLGPGTNELFVDGQMMPEARWPKMGTLSRPIMSSIATATVTASGNGSSITITDPSLTQAAGTLVGASINTIANLLVAQTGTITSNSPGTLTYTTATPLYSQLSAGNPYFIFGTTNLISNSGDWAMSSGAISFMPTFSDALTNHTLEVKHRSVGIDLSGRSYISLQGISLFGCSIISTSASSNLSLSNIQSSFAGHKMVLNDPWKDTDLGIQLNGSNNTLTNSVVAYTSGAGITLSGTNCSVVNCQIHDVDYSGSNAAAVTVAGSNINVSNDTIYNAGRHGISHYNTSAATISNNEIFYYGLQGTDCGATYSYKTDCGNTVISYNLIHDATNGGALVSGLFLDDACLNAVVHHNLVYGVDVGFHLNNPATNILVANNTLDASTNAVQMWLGINYINVTMANNIETLPNLLYPGIVLNLLTNVVWPANPMFVNAGAGNYTLQAGSPAIAAGTVISGITGASTPDVGAFAYNATPWTAGANVGLATPPPPNFLAGTAGLGQVALTWKARPEATSYNVYRSANKGGPFTLIGNNVKTAAYTDTTAAQNSTNYYLVTGVNATGEGGYSTQASAYCYAAIQLNGLIGEYYTAHNAADQWSGTVYSTPVFRRLDPNINFNWGIVGPGGGLSGSQFSIIWTGTVAAPATGTYTFTLEADTGSRLYVNNQLLVNQFDVPGTNSGTINLVAGQSYPIRIEYEKVNGLDSVNLYWSYPGQNQVVVPSSALSPYPGNGMEGAYYNDSPTTFGGFTNYMTTRLDTNFSQWWDWSPAPGVNAEWWSCHWRGQILAPVTATYTFSTFADNGEQLTVNGQVVTSRWQNTVGTETGTIQLQAGQLYNVQLDYANGTTWAGIGLKWSFPGLAPQVVPSKYLYPPMLSNINGIEGVYYMDPNFSKIGMNRVDSGVNFDWTTNAPAPSIPSTNYSVRWSGQVLAPITGSHMFYLSGLGHGRLIVNGSILVDNSSDTAWDVKANHTLNFTAGQRYDIQVEYAADTVPGKLQLSWSYSGQPRTVVPASNLFLNYDNRN